MENEENKTTENQEVEVKEEETEEKRETLKLPEKPEEKSTIIVDGIKYPKELIEEARKEGWRDKSFLKDKGMDNKYLDPATFIERGKKAVPFLNKKIDERDQQIETLTTMLKKQMADNVKDRMEKVDTKIKEAKEYNEFDNIEGLVERKLELKDELDRYNKAEEPQQPQKPVEVYNWELENDWVYDNSPYNVKKTDYATTTLIKIGQQNPNLSIAEHLRILDLNLTNYDSKIQQKANVSIPVESQSSGRVTPTETRSIVNLTSKMKAIFQESCVDAKGNKFTGIAMKEAERVFLDSCSEECFKK
jgi:hypothetical protein